MTDPGNKVTMTDPGFWTGIFCLENIASMYALLLNYILGAQFKLALLNFTH